MLNLDQIEQAAQHLFQVRKTKIPGTLIPEACRPTDRESAIAVQQRVMELMGLPIGGGATDGWKCGVPKPNGPLVFASIPASAISRTSPYSVPAPKGAASRAKIEPEIAFVVAQDLPPRATPYNDDEIRGAIGQAHMVLELLGTRYADASAASPIDLLADSYNNVGLLIGPVIPNVFNLPLDVLPVRITSPTQTLYDKTSPHPSGHPMKSFSWLVHFLNQRGLGLKAGQIVTTGSYAGVVETPLSVPITVELGGAGVIVAELVAEAA